MKGTAAAVAIDTGKTSLRTNEHPAPRKAVCQERERGREGERERGTRGERGGRGEKGDRGEKE